MPLTATPFKQNETYKELRPRNPELKKYIRCFWGSEKPYIQKKEHSAQSIIIPDTCADILYRIDYTDNTITGGFCGINDASFRDCDDRACGHLVSTFAVRFYAWGAYAFAQDSMRDTVNGFYDARSRFGWLDKVLRQQLFEKGSLEERGKVAEEAFLKKRFEVKRLGIRQSNVMNDAVRQIVVHRGVLSAARLAEECFVSGRQLERLFHEYIGITPKKLCNLVRYQCLWGEAVMDPAFCIADAVYRYGFTDQSHLMREFKRYHTMDIKQARAYACNDVGNIQYFCDGLYYDHFADRSICP